MTATLLKPQLIAINARELSQILGDALRIIPSRPSSPMIGCVFIEAIAQDQRIRVTATDCDRFLVIEAIADEITEDFAVIVSAKLLSDIVAKMDGAIALELEGESLILKSGSGRYVIQIADHGEDGFLKVPELKGEPIALPSAAFQSGLSGVLFAASNDETKQILTGVHLLAESGDLEFAATDGHRLAVCKIPGLDADDAIDFAPFAVTIPGVTLRSLKAMTTDYGGAIEVTADRGLIAFRWGDYHLTSRTVEGQYPAYNQLIPQQFDRKITIERKPLLAALDRVSVIADQKSNHLVKFLINPDDQSLLISADAQDAGRGQEEINSAQISGEAIEMAFNIKYLMESLKNLTTTEVQIQINTPTSPAVITPLGGSKTTHLVMPVQVRN